MWWMTTTPPAFVRSSGCARYASSSAPSAPVIQIVSARIASLIALLNFRHEFDLDREVERQFRHADRRACVAPDLRAEHLDEQVGRAVDDSGGLVEPGRAVDHAENFHDPGH